MNVATLLQDLRPAAARKFGNDRRWAKACGLPPETLSGVGKREPFDLRTLAALPAAVGLQVVGDA